MTPAPPLAGRIAVVTGAGQGIGGAIALALAGAGAALALAGRTRARLEARAAEIVRAGGRALVAPTDVTQDGEVARLMADTEAALGGVDILVAAAGLAVFGPVADQRPGDWDAMLAANLRGAMACCHAALAPMRRRGGGTILAVASVAAARPIPGSAAYAATKAGLVAFCRVLAEEVRGDGIRVGVLAPGAVDTPLWDGVPGGPDRARMLQPEDVARAAVLMATLPPRAALEELTLLPAGGIL